MFSENQVDARKYIVQQIVPVPFRNRTWDEFAATLPKAIQAMELVRQYCERLRAGHRGPLLLYGNPGGGKTYLASLLVQDFGMSVRDRKHLDDARAAGTAVNLVWINGSKIPDLAKKDSADREYHTCTAYLGVLDDADKCPAGNWSTVLLGLIENRVISKPAPTIITCNASPAQLVRKYGDCGGPIMSRIVRCGGTVVHVPK